MKQLTVSALRTAGHSVMWPFERFAKAKHNLSGPPVFIIGAPRSGTSLLYELMITRFRFAYMSNASHRFFRTPLTASKIFKNAILDWSGDFTSQYGHIDGWGAPNEGGWIWQRWLNDGDWTDGTGFNAEYTPELRHLTNGLAAILEAPFLNKNVMHSNRLKLMHQIWPDALYIEVQRDILDNARSIVRAERTEAGPGKAQDIWWSVRPKIAAQFVGKADTQRAVAQVFGVTQDIDSDITGLDPSRRFKIEYSMLCKEPEDQLSALKGFLASKGCSIDDRLDVPLHFPARPSRPLEDSDETVMTETLQSLAGE